MQVFSSLEDHPFCLGRYLNKWKLCDACVLSDLSESPEEIDILDSVGTLYGGWVRAHYLLIFFL